MDLRVNKMPRVSKKKVLFIIGTPNQTTQMHQIAMQMGPDFDCWYTQFYPDTWYEKMIKGLGILEQTIMSGHWKRQGDKYLADNGLQNDYMAQKNEYDLVFFCTDMLVPRKLRKTKTIWIQEAMIDKMTPLSRVVKATGIPRYFALNTSLNGSSNLCDIYCAASEGYKNYFIKMGTDADKIIATGVPNFDNIDQYRNNNFPHHGYVMVATSDIREAFNKEDRPAFLRDCVKKANGRQLLFKLHPNELRERAIQEIKDNTPANSLIYTEGSSEEMVANCDELITQFSSLAFVGLSLGKKTHSFFDIEELLDRNPIQNGGTSAQYIAEMCMQYVEFKGTGAEFLKQYKSTPKSVAV